MAKKILLIEYEPRYLDRIRGHLAGKDFDLIVAKDGDEGLESYRQSRPDVVLISSVLPKLRTPDVIKGMQALGATPPVVLMMSGYKGKNKRQDAQRVGATSILEKPFTEEAFLGELDSALSFRPESAPSGLPSNMMIAGNKAPLLSAEDIFSDVLSGMDDAPPFIPQAPTLGTDPGIQRKLEQTLSGILPAPKKSSTAAIPKIDPAAPSRAVPTSPAEPTLPAAKPVERAPFEANVDGTVRLPVQATTPPAPAPRPRIDSSVDRLLTETLSGLKSPKPVEKSAKPMNLGLEAYERVDKTERLERTAASAAAAAFAAQPKPAPEFKPEPPREREVAPLPAPSVEAPIVPSARNERPAERPVEKRAERPAEKPYEEKRREVTGVPGGFGRYSLLERIAAGGMAEVFKARMRGEEGFEKIVAIKRILPHMADNDDFITMFIDEAKLAAQLTHNNIIHIYDLGKVDAYHYIAMEYVEGRDLRTILKLGQDRGYPLPAELALFVASKIANALDYAHRRMGMDGKELDLVHRDVSPQNILISYEGDIKLCDFGIAKAATKVSQTQTGALKGKLQYMSPEQAWGKKIDRRTDIFSLGIVLFEMLTGERLFTGDTDLTILEQVRDARVLAPSTRNAEVPKKVDQIVLKALAKNPQDRYQNASELEKDINAVLYTFQPSPGPADLAIYMHRLSEATPMPTDEAIDAAFAHSESVPVEKAKKGKGLVISKRAAAPLAPIAAPAPNPLPAPIRPMEVSQPALSIGGEHPSSRTGLYAGIGVAVAVLLGGYFVFARKSPTPAITTSNAPTVVPAVVPPEPSKPAVEPTRIIDQKAFDAEVKRLAAEKEKQLREAAKAQSATAKTPLAAPTAAGAASAAAPSLAQSRPLLPPKGAEPAAAPEKPAEAVAKPTVEPVKIAEAAPAPKPPPPVVEAPASAPSTPIPQNAPANPAVQMGDLVGPGEGVIEPKLLRLAPVTGLPPQARQIQVQRGANGVIGSPMILALITENGVVSETRILKVSNYKFVDEAAVNALKNSKFEPATKSGVKVKMWKTFTVPVRP